MFRGQIIGMEILMDWHNFESPNIKNYIFNGKSVRVREKRESYQNNSKLDVTRKFIFSILNINHMEMLNETFL